MIVSNKKCMACKFERISAEWHKHKSHTTLSMVDRYYSDLKSKENSIETHLCYIHKQSHKFVEFVKNATDLFKTIQRGVMLPVIRR